MWLNKPFLSENLLAAKVIVSHSSPRFWTQDPFTLLEVIKDPKELFFEWAISINVYHIKN